LNTIEKIHGNVQKQLKNKKFKNAHSMNLPKIQSGLQQQMKKIDDTESSIAKDLKETKSGIFKLKLKAMKPKGPGGLLGFLMGGIAPIAFTIIGGLILITLARLALKKWADTYMPKPDGSKMSILGIPIPGWDRIKALGMGIKNFITVGLPNMWDRLKHFIGNVKKQLFGKKGAFRDAIETKNTLIKIFLAILIANTAKAGGWIVKLLFKALSFIPFVGPLFGFLADFGPLVYKFISTQIMLIWSNKKANDARLSQSVQLNQMVTGKSQAKSFKNMILATAKGVKPFKGQLNTIPGLQTSSSAGGKVPTKGAIMRSVPTHQNKNFDSGKDRQKDKLKEDKKAAVGDVENRIKDNNQGDMLVAIHNAMQKHRD